MTTRKRLILFMVLSVATVLAFVARHRIRAKLGPWENSGDYAGPLTRAAIPYDSSKPPSRPWLDPKKTTIEKTTHHTYAASTLNGNQTDYLLYLPPGYDEPANADRRYPVIYWLHGYSCEPQHGAPFVDALDAAIRAGHAPPAIAVLPNGLYDSWYVDSANGAQPVESVIIKDLIPHVDKTYRTIRDRRARALEGFSMGGWGALHLAFKYPELFCAVTSVSAPFHRAERFWQLQGIFGDAANYYAEDPVTRARRDPAAIRGNIRIRLLCGDKDEQGHLGYNLSFDKRLTEWQISHQTTILKAVGHNDSDIYDQLGPSAFDFYKTAFSQP
jgi:endo-1,4-beta-xylanase